MEFLPERLDIAQISRTILNRRRIENMIVISPAKRLNSVPSNATLKTTQPIFDTQAKFLAEQLSKLQADDLSNLMGISSNIAELNAERFKNWDSISIPEKRAIFQFQGDVFKHLNARDFSQDDENYMNDKLRILSGMYGVLKPSDKMNPYRLEMGTRYPFGTSKSLYEFWGDKIASQIKLDLQTGFLFNLASKEYFSSIKKYIDISQVIHFKFLSISNGKERVVGVVAKRARGEMTRFLIKNRVEDINKINEFTSLDFKFRQFENNCFTFVQD